MIFPLTPEKLKKQLAEINHQQNDALIKVDKLKDKREHDLETKVLVFNKKKSQHQKDCDKAKTEIEERFREQILNIKRKQQDEVQQIQNALHREEQVIQNKYNEIGDVDRRIMADACREYRERCDKEVNKAEELFAERSEKLNEINSSMEGLTEFIKKNGRLKEALFTDEALEDLIAQEGEFDREAALETLTYDDVFAKVEQLHLSLNDLEKKIQKKLIFKIFQIIRPWVAYVIIFIIHTLAILFSYNYKPDFLPLLHPVGSAAVSLFLLTSLLLIRKSLLKQLIEKQRDEHAQILPLITFSQELAETKKELHSSEEKNAYLKIQGREDGKLDEKLRLIEIEQLVEMDKISKGYYEKIHKIEGVGNKALELILKERQELWDQQDVRAEEAIRQLSEDHESSLAEFEKNSLENIENESLKIKEKLKSACLELKQSISESEQYQEVLFPSFEQALESWSPQSDFHNQTAFASMDVSLYDQIKHPEDPLIQEQLPESITIPTLLELPQNGSIYINAGQSRRSMGLKRLRNTLLRILLTIPPGKARFTFIDPLSLGENFAAFMHLNDYQEILTGGKISTKTGPIDQDLNDLNNHLEKVIQKYLRNEYSNICKYNLAAGEIAEPFRFLAIADFPFNFSEDAVKRLITIAQNGARCGVYLIIHHNPEYPVPGNLRIDEIKNHCIFLEPQDDTFEWKKSPFKQTRIKASTNPSPELMNELIKKVGAASSNASVVKIPFEKIQETSLWKASSKNSLSVTMGLTGTRQQELQFGHGTAQHCLLAGKTGSGKSNLIHVIITNMAIKYSPKELQFFLIDFKKGVEFKIYANEKLPHARAIAIESDREFGLSVLRKIDEELKERGDKFRNINAQNISQFRDNSHEDMPRILLVIDEFQEFFTEDDNLAKDAVLLMDRIVRQGRAFGIHVLLGSQTLGGAQTLPRSTMGQMGIRIALQCNESDSYLIFNENNNAARLLSRPGEAILNNHSGLPEHNSPFQTAWLSEDKHHKELLKLRSKETGHPFIFEGNIPAELEDCKDYLESSDPSEMFIGEPCAIEVSQRIKFIKSPSQNALLITANKEMSLGIFMNALAKACQQKQEEQFFLLNGSQGDPQAQKYFDLLEGKIKTFLPGKADELIENLHQTLSARQENNQGTAIYVFAADLQRFRKLQKKEDFSWDETEKSNADKLEELIQQGPEHNIHFVIHCDSFSSYQRILSNKLLQDFDIRLLSQMSQTDSLACIDKSEASKLELHTALLYQDHNGLIKKFRPYALPSLAFYKGQMRS